MDGLDYIECLEFMIASLIHEGKRDLAALWAEILEYLYTGDTVIAAFLAENPILPHETASDIRKIFHVRPFGGLTASRRVIESRK